MLTPILEREITTLSEAKEWIEELYAQGMLFHFDDSTHDIGNTIDGQWVNLWSEEEADIISDRRDELYDKSFDWGEFGCPIGYALHVSGHVTEQD